MSEHEYKPSYFCPSDEPGTAPIYYDFIIVCKDGISWTYAAWGDGAHINQVAASGCTDTPLKSQNICYHNNQLEDFFRNADILIAVKDHKVVYKKGV